MVIPGMYRIPRVPAYPECTSTPSIHKYNHNKDPLFKRADKAQSYSMHWPPHVVAFALLPLGLAYARDRRLRQKEG